LFDERAGITAMACAVSKVGGHECDAFRISHQRLQRGPLRLELLLFRQLLAFGDFLELRVVLRQLGGVQAELGTEGAMWGD
jgi:hypothetical protein